MWISSILQILVLTAAGPQTAAPPPVETANSPAAIHWRERLFAIPFHVGRPDRTGNEPVEVQLFVSGDRGGRWDLYKAVPPTQKKFLFRAGCDGEYWFCVRTLDRSGKINPLGPAVPGLKVIVDSAPPKLQLEARRGDGGQIVVRWQVEETALKPESLVIQYRVGRTATWQPVAIGRQDIRTTGVLHTGEVTWLAPAAPGALEIRCEVADVAGNPAVSQVVLDENRSVASSVSDPGSNSPRAAVGAPPPGSPSGGQIAGGSGAETARPAQDWRAGQPDAPAANWPAENVRGDAARSLAGQPTDAQTVGLPSRPNPPIGNQYLVPGGSGSPGPAPSTEPVVAVANGGVPVGERVRWVGARSFELEYDTEAPGPAGIGRVELWGTRDGGRTWLSFGVDEKRRSPMVVNVDQEGIYGFRITVQNGAGQGGLAPRSGELPEIWIGVDQTRPTAQITAVEPGTGAEAGKVTISWTANDNQRLAQRPISLSFSETPGGPWTPIAAGLENTGHHTWTLDHLAPQRVYLRLEARDEAGNVAAHESPEPVALHRPAPAARIREVRPLGESGPQQGQQQRYYLR